MSCGPHTPLQRFAGFTLLEAVVAIVITGILAGMVAVFIRPSIDAYFASARRADLTDAADAALRRIARDVRAGLPNSLRTTTPASTACFEFLPVVGGGRYRVAQSNTSAGDILDFSTADTSFDVLAPMNLPASFKSAPAQHVVIYNLGIAGADAYAGNTRAAIDTGAATAATAANIVLTAGKKFPFESPGKRFQVIPDFSVVYSCSGGNLERSTRALATPLAQMAACPAAGTGTLVVGNVAACSFDYTPVASQRGGLLAITLTLTDPSGESVNLYREVHVDNVP